MSVVLVEWAREVIIEYWVRVLISPAVSLNDITQMIARYGDQYEQFDFSSNRYLRYERDNLVITGIVLLFHIHLN